MIRVSLNIPAKYMDRAEYVFRFLSASWGLPVAFTGEAPHIVYGCGLNDISDVLEIPFDEQLYKPETVCSSIYRNGSPVWARTDDLTTTDIIGSTFRLLTFLDESQVPHKARDDKGTFVLDVLPANRRAVAQIPLADIHANLLLERLLADHPEFLSQMLPRWPDGARYAICLTHDTDVVNLGAPKELLKNLMKVFLTRDRTYLKMVREGCRFIGKSEENPAYGFPVWKGYEAANELRSCFYLFMTAPGVRFHLNDCKSDVIADKVNWAFLRDMAKDGWEFGYHPPINAKHVDHSFVHGKLMLEQHLGVPIHGLRHHWWALDWFSPYKTFRKHVEAGYKYDSSIAWRGGPGFRAATCLPFKPYDNDQEISLPIYELPVCLMDDHVTNHLTDFATAVEKSVQTIETVKQHGGMAVLDWHTEGACNTMIWKNTLSVLERTIEKYSYDKDAWFATPLEIVNHWSRRMNMIYSHTRRNFALGRSQIMSI